MSKGINPILVTPDVDVGGSMDLDTRVESILNGHYDGQGKNVQSNSYKNGKIAPVQSQTVRRPSAVGSNASTITAANENKRGQTPIGSIRSVGPSSSRQVPRIDDGSSGRSFLILGLVFIASIFLLWWAYKSFPELDAAEKEYFKLPRNIEDAKKLGSILNRYKDKYYREVLSGVFVVYVFLQTFAIPGSIFLSILSGFLFPFWTALLLVCFCSATGASFCYGLSQLVGKRLIYKYFPEKVQAWSETVNRHRDNLLNYIIFLRITPFLPNWFINIASPVIGVPLISFWVGTFIGVAPPTFVAIQAGTTLNQLTSSSDALTWTSLLVLVVLGVFSLAPVLLKNILGKKFV